MSVLRRDRMPVWRPARMVCAAVAVAALLSCWSASAFGDDPSFGITAFDGLVADAGGNYVSQAGGHPDVLTTWFDFNTFTDPDVGPNLPVEDVKDITVDLPPGLVGSVAGLSQCTATELANGTGATNPLPLCPSTSQIGTMVLRVDLGPTNAVPVFNMVPPPNVPARFGANVAGSSVVLDASLVHSAAGYHFRVRASNVPEGLVIDGNTFTLWGVPSDPSHTPDRACPGQPNPTAGGPTCGSGDPARAFFRTPTSCTGSAGLPTTLTVDSWQHPGVFRDMTFLSHDTPGYPLAPASWGSEHGTDGCDVVPFEPTVLAQPAVGAKAGAPAGFAFDVTLPQTDEPTAIAQSDLKSATVTLPAGVRVSPSSADGLGACNSTQIGLETTDLPTCPDSSKLGTVRIETPLIDEAATGNVYLATPFDNPFKSLVAVYIVASVRGVVVKIPGQITMNATTGQITATFDNNPQVPFSRLHLEFNGGPRAPLVTPARCGTYTTHSVLDGWNGRTVERKSTFTLDQGVNGACPIDQFKPTLAAGTENPAAGRFAPFGLQLLRTDEDQEFQSLRSLSLPPGLSASLRGTTYCPDSALDSADTSKSPAHTGAQELAAPSCPASSRIGSATVGAGAGPSPFYVDTGKMYLAGPYRGAPLSIAVSVPAVAGPFDLGNVITRAALYIDPSDASLRAVSDPFPTILDGIPLQIKDIRLNVDRPHFMLNPTNCSQMSVDGTVLSTENMSADVHSRFQVGECAALGFKPKLSFRLKGGTKRGDHPKFQATLKARPGDANIDRVSVALPHSEFLDQAHIGTVCTRPQFAAGKCPPASVYGYARAITPLLDKPLEGPVYLRSSDNKLPDLVADLNGQIHIVLDGRIDSVNGGIRNTFDVIPDAPVSKFTLNMQGGKKGLLVNSTNLCKKDSFAVAKVRGQNGAYANQNPQMKNDCGAKHGKKKH